MWVKGGKFNLFFTKKIGLSMMWMTSWIQFVIRWMSKKKLVRLLLNLSEQSFLMRSLFFSIFFHFFSLFKKIKQPFEHFFLQDELEAELEDLEKELMQEDVSRMPNVPQSSSQRIEFVFVCFIFENSDSQFSFFSAVAVAQEEEEDFARLEAAMAL